MAISLAFMALTLTHLCALTSHRDGLSHWPNLAPARKALSRANF